MYYLIENKEQFDHLFKKDFKEVFMEIISLNDHIHPNLNKISLIYLRSFDSTKGYMLSIDHSESLPLGINGEELFDIFSKFEKIWVRNKKQFLYFFPLKNIYDVSFLKKTEEYYTEAHDFISNRSSEIEINKIIPIVKHYERCEFIFDQIKTLDLNNIPSWFDHYNNKVTLAYLGIEKNGIYLNYDIYKKNFNTANDKYLIDQNTIYSQYNLYNLTKRVTNSFFGLNFLALNKNNESRKAFVPRNDFLIEIDISAYHPTLISNIIKYKFENGIYEELSKELNVDTNEIKKIVFSQIYGGIKPEYENIKYFSKIKTFVENQWEKFQKDGFLETPISGYRFEKNNLEKINPYKLFNYIIQETETISNSDIILKILKILKGKKSKLILCVYDSFLIDWDEREIKELESIKEIFNNKHFNIKIKQGYNYYF